ncbi:NHL repeat-containing protein [Conexibacter woesei]|uniref:NHL repeat-containing protein n=1 Tax=Conexibacter woesei TaxID=191495 RepID=UPI00047ED8C8|nr:NHL repeat-containing protein [Conexibacter woesei]
MLRRRRLLPSLLIAAGALLAAAVATPTAALADCPGSSSVTCAYASVSQTGFRGGGVLRFPQAVAVGPDGNVYVTDQGSHLVQKFTPAGQWLMDIGSAGTRPGELSAIGAIAVTGDNQVVVADGGSNRVVRFSGDSGGLIGSWGGPGNDLGKFHFGAGGGNDAAAGGGLAASGSTLYIVDTGNDRVVRFQADGGGGSEIVPPGTLQNPRGVAVRGTRMLVADDQHHRVAAFDTGGHLLASIGAGQGAGPGQLNFPYGVAIDAQGRVFVADDMNQRIVRYSTPATKYQYKARWGSYGTGPGQLAYPRGAATNTSGELFVANTGNDRIDVFDASGTLKRSFGTSGRASGQFDAPLGAAADSSGIRAVTDSVNGRVQLLNPDNSIATTWGSPNPGPTILPDPVAVAFDNAGNGYVLDQRRSRIVVFDRASAQTPRSIGSEGSGPGQLQSPTALSIDIGGNIAVADYGNARIARFSTSGQYLGSFPTEAGPRGVAVAPDGSRIWVAEADNHIRVYDPTGMELADYGGTGSKVGKFNAPAQIALDAGGNLWVADRGNNRIQELGPNGERLGAFGTRGTGDGSFIHPTGVSVDCNNKLTVTDTENNRVSTFQLAAGAATGCGQLAAPGAAPVLKSPTLPEPLGPQLTVKILRKAGVLSARNLPVRIGCDTTCDLTATATIVQRGTARIIKKGRKKKVVKPVSIDLPPIKVSIPAGTSRIVRLQISKAQAAKLRKALGRQKGLDVTLQLEATAAAGQPTSEAERIQATA